MSVTSETITLKCDGCGEDIDPDSLYPVRIYNPENAEPRLDFHDYGTCVVLWAQRHEQERNDHLAAGGVAKPEPPQVAVDALLVNARQVVDAGGDVAATTPETPGKATEAAPVDNVAAPAVP
jgi:hypothetical protein